MDDIRVSNYSAERFRRALKQRGVFAETYPATLARLEAIKRRLVELGLKGKK